MKEKNNFSESKYFYARLNGLYVKATNIIGLLASLLMLFGLILLCIRNAIYFVLFTPLILVFFFYYTTHYIFNLFYKNFKFQIHQDKTSRFWMEKTEKSPVDIFIPYSGEGISIIKQTCLAVKNIDYGNKKVYILDDSGDPNVKTLAEELEIGYFSRPDRGYMKKGGNIKYAMDHTDGEFIIVFDADFVPEPEFIKELLPYFSDEKIGIVQSPQFYKDVDSKNGNMLTKASSFLSEDFYKIIQTSRNNVYAAICVGTNVIYRRSSLVNSGGIALVPYCEDFETGFNVTSAGYFILYIPLILAYGRTPDNPQAYFNQHRRWCYSCLRLLLSKKLYTAPISGSIRLAYLSNISYYLTEAVSILTILLFSIMMIIEQSVIDTRYFAYFIPYFLFLFILQPYNRIRRINIGSFIVATLQSFTYLYTVLVMIFTRKLDWVPSNLKIKKLSPHFINFMVLTSVVIFVETFNILNALLQKNITFRLWESYPFVIWFTIIILTHLSLLIYIIRYSVLKAIKKTDN